MQYSFNKNSRIHRYKVNQNVVMVILMAVPPCNIKRSIFYIDSHTVYGISHRREGGCLAKGENWKKGRNSQLQLRIAATSNWCYSIVSAESDQQASAVCEL
jgi:hypothetical protein